MSRRIGSCSLLIPTSTQWLGTPILVSHAINITTPDNGSSPTAKIERIRGKRNAPCIPSKRIAVHWRPAGQIGHQGESDNQQMKQRLVLELKTRRLHFSLLKMVDQTRSQARGSLSLGLVSLEDNPAEHGEKRASADDLQLEDNGGCRLVRRYRRKYDSD